jgi:hypothetical protein
VTLLLVDADVLAAALVVVVVVDDWQLVLTHSQYAIVWSCSKG